MVITTMLTTHAKAIVRVRLNRTGIPARPRKRRALAIGPVLCADLAVDVHIGVRVEVEIEIVQRIDARAEDGGQDPEQEGRAEPDGENDGWEGERRLDKVTHVVSIHLPGNSYRSPTCDMCRSISGFGRIRRCTHAARSGRHRAYACQGSRAWTVAIVSASAGRLSSR